MLATARHQYILAVLRKRGSVSIKDLQKVFRVSSMTVWRDLKMLEDWGLLRRIYGGACGLGHLMGELDYETKDRSARDAKRRIAEFAVREFVEEGDVVAMEGGTTVGGLIACFPQSQISILTNSLPVAMQARSHRPNDPVFLAGGWMSRVSGNTCGPETLHALERRRASVCFLSATAFDGEIGPSDPNPMEIEAKRMLASRAQTVVLLLDARKFGSRSSAATLHLRRVHALVTDAKPPAAEYRLIKKYGVRLFVV